MKSVSSDLARLLAPAVIGFTCSRMCKIPTQAGQTQPQRPPASVFPIIWSLLYILIGLAWMVSKNDIIFSLLNGLLGSWLIVYACRRDKKNALYILAAICSTTVAAMVLCRNFDICVYALVPLLTWCQIAFLLNWHDLQ